ncbi:MAG: DUF4830 domain-containing protein [Oscillospiraceae bacterium]|nr:DUF4830 domain-containing protein [Oscillospiraceae bacterium]
MTRPRAVALVLSAAAILLALLGLRLLLSRTDCGVQEGRLRFLERLGWQVEAESVSREHMRLQDELSGVTAEYNRMQKEQGYDLSRHLGESCDVYSYRVTNYPDCGQTVLVTLYVQGRRVIAGDVHSTALDGFMHGLKRN